MGSGHLQAEDILKEVSISAVFGYHHVGGMPWKSWNDDDEVWRINGGGASSVTWNVWSMWVLVE